MEKINIALASFGMSGRVFHAPFLYRHPGFRLSAAVERSKKMVEGLYPGVRSVDSYEELLRDNSIEVIVVNVPDQLHYEFTRQALEAGKHAVVEKPFVMDIAQGEELIRLAEEKQRILTVFQSRRWDGDFRTVAHEIEQGELGRVVEFESNYMRYRKEIQQDTWKEARGVGSGVTYNLGSHMIDQALVLFGRPTGIQADIDGLRDGTQVDDYYYIRLIYPKLKVTLRASYLVREETARYAVHGTEGSFVKYGLDPQEELLKKDADPYADHYWGMEDEKWWGTLNTGINGKYPRSKVRTLPGNYGIFYDKLYESIRNGAPLAVPAEHALYIVRLIQAAFKSSETGATVTV